MSADPIRCPSRLDLVLIKFWPQTSGTWVKITVEVESGCVDLVGGGAAVAGRNRPVGVGDPFAETASNLNYFREQRDREKPRHRRIPQSIPEVWGWVRVIRKSFS